jgi:hypothetical protein
MSNILHTNPGKSFCEYDPGVPCVIGTIKEFLFREEFRGHMNKGLELLIEKKQIHLKMGWLVNGKSQPTMLEEDITWVATEWGDRAVAAGVRYIALVLPDDEIAKLSQEYFDQDFKKDGMTLKQFKDLESARQWLHNMLK